MIKLGERKKGEHLEGQYAFTVNWYTKSTAFLKVAKYLIGNGM